jgi:hypothetical protein
VVAECAHENEAQLIAAAPELLAACKAVLASDEAAIRQLRAIGCNTVGDQRITGMLRAAIAKAEDGLTPEQVAALSVEVES